VNRFSRFLLVGQDRLEEPLGAVVEELSRQLDGLVVAGDGVVLAAQVALDDRRHVVANLEPTGLLEPPRLRVIDQCTALTLAR
jgi:hypothetical protein